jgi:hypothetical protein
VPTGYGYDSVCQLLQVVPGGTTKESYTYDPVGEHVQIAVTPILLAPFGGDCFGNVADCWDQEAKCLAQLCRK